MLEKTRNTRTAGELKHQDTSCEIQTSYKFQAPDLKQIEIYPLRFRRSLAAFPECTCDLPGAKFSRYSHVHVGPGLEEELGRTKGYCLSWTIGCGFGANWA